jgi:hypothetical protein
VSRCRQFDVEILEESHVNSTPKNDHKTLSDAPALLNGGPVYFCNCEIWKISQAAHDYETSCVLMRSSSGHARQRNGTDTRPFLLPLFS